MLSCLKSIRAEIELMEEILKLDNKKLEPFKKPIMDNLIKSYVEEIIPLYGKMLFYIF